MKMTLNFPTISGADLYQNWEDNVYRVKRTNGAELGTISGKTFDGVTEKTGSCSEIVFHAPSEHKIDGEQFDLEMQIICTATSNTSDGTNNIGIVSFLFEHGEESDFLEKLTDDKVFEFTELED
jgi:carbonic anhydrase